jgi:hypothetical protein
MVTKGFTQAVQSENIVAYPDGTVLKAGDTGKMLVSNSSSAVVTWTLPALSSVGSRVFTFQNSGQYDLIIQRAGSDTFDTGQTLLNIRQGEVFNIYSDGTVWQTMSNRRSNTGPHKNLLINPRFVFVQRGAGPWTTNGGFTCDRWKMNWDGTGVTYSVSQAAFTLGQSSVPNNPDFAMNCVCTVAGTSSTVKQFYQVVEDVRRFDNRIVTVSFWAAASVAGQTVQVVMNQNFGTGGSPSASVITTGPTFALTTTYKRYSATIQMPSIAGKTFGTNGDHCALLVFRFSGTSTFNILIAEPQLEYGPFMTDFEVRVGVDEAYLVRRFCQIVQWSMTVPVAGTMNNTIGLPVALRTTPTISVLSAGTFASTNTPFESISSVSQLYVQLTATASGGSMSSRTVLLDADI